MKKGREWHPPKPLASITLLLQVGEGAPQQVGYNLM